MTSMDDQWTCDICGLKEPALITGEPGKDRIIKIFPAWLGGTRGFTVFHKGEEAFPCPTCNQDKAGNTTITDWDELPARVHKRLRQHYADHHGKGKGPKTLLTKADYEAFVKNKHQLRCDAHRGRGNRWEPGPASSPTLPSDPYGPSVKSEHSTSKNLRGLVSSTSASYKPVIPAGYCAWLMEETSNSEATRNGYLQNVRYFFSWLAAKKGIETNSLQTCWDLDLILAFFRDIQRHAVAPTLYKYYCAFTSVHQYLAATDIRHPTPAEETRFRGLKLRAAKLKRQHHIDAKARKAEQTPSLRIVKSRIIKNKEVCSRFRKLVRKARQSRSLLPAEFGWATAYTILILQSSNFKRNGNLRKLHVDTARQCLERSMRKARKAKPGVKPSPCHFAIYRGTKTGGKEIFTIVDPQKMRVVWDYIRWIRPNCPEKPSSSELFINSKGKSLHNQVAQSLRALGKRHGVPNLVIKDLRSAVETRAARLGHKVDRKEVAQHLAHTEETRDRHYLLPTEGRSEKAAFDIETLMSDDTGESSAAETSDDEPADILTKEKETKDSRTPVPMVRLTRLDPHWLKHPPKSLSHFLPTIKLRRTDPNGRQDTQQTGSQPREKINLRRRKR